VEFLILGPLEVLNEGRPLSLPMGRGRALLALLILHPGQVVSTDRLIDELWGEEPPVTATTALQGLVSNLRKRLEPSNVKGETPTVLKTHPPGYVLAVDPDQVDAFRFKRLLKEASGAQALQRAAMVRTALSLWRGPALADFAYQPFAQIEITSLGELRIAAMEEWIDADLALGRHGQLVAELEGLVSEYPLRERLQEQLMLALYRAGRQAEALDAYRNVRRTLVEELGIEPGPALQRLEGAILRQDPSLDLSQPESTERTAEPAEVEAAAGAPWLPPGRKTVTVVFVDLAPVDVEGTSDPEARRRTIGLGYDLAARAFTSHGGAVEGLIGDVVVAVFGVPLAREDDAVRAVRAAAELRRELATLNEELQRDRRSRLAARIGINTGEVLVGRPGAEHPAASGDAVNVAARLQQAAAEEEALLGEATRRLIGTAARVERAEGLTLRATAWRLLDLVPDIPVRLAGLETPMVGREAELAELRSVFERTVRNQMAEVVTLLGEAGIGKSRLAREFAATLGADALVLTGHCLPYGEGITFWPLRDIVLQATGGSGRNGILELLADEDEAEFVATQVAGAIGLTQEPGRPEKLFPSVRRLFEALARTQPLVVVLEDVHWAQPTLLELVDYLAGSIRQATLLVCLARPEYLHHRRAWAEDRDNVASIVLNPLEPEDTEKLIAARLAGEILPPETVEQIVATAQGNPLFLEQMLVALEEEAELSIPPSVQALLAARLDRLGPAERDLIRCASVVGIEFSMEALSALVPTQARPYVSKHLEALQDKELIRPSERPFLGNPAMSFRHVLIQLAAHRSITRQVRSELHERVALLLESEAGASSMEFDEIIGYHLERASIDLRDLGLVDGHSHALAVRAGEKLAGAGLRAFAKFDAAAAENLLSRAKGLLPLAHRHRSEVTRRLAEAYTVMGRHDDADKELAGLLEEMKTDENAGMQWFIRVERARIRLATGPDPTSLDAIREEAKRALVAFESAGDQAGMAQALFLLGMVHMRLGELSAMEQVARRGLACANSSGSAREELGARWAVAMALEAGSTPVPECISSFEELVRWRGTEHPGVLADLARLRAMLGEFDEARELIAGARRLLAEQTRARRPLGLVSRRAAEVEIMAGDLAAGERALRAALELNLAMGERDMVSQISASLSRLLSIRGDSEEAARFASISMDHAPAEGVSAQALWRAAMARVLASRQDSREPERLARQAIDLVPAEMLNLAADLQVELAEILLATGPVQALHVVGVAAELYQRKGNLIGQMQARALGEQVRAQARFRPQGSG
jgi:DNA-binding SARP family transcriptional activator/tetratricopeptide (TPR) repeat protein